MDSNIRIDYIKEALMKKPISIFIFLCLVTNSVTFFHFSFRMYPPLFPGWGSARMWWPGKKARKTAPDGQSRTAKVTRCSFLSIASK